MSKPYDPDHPTVPKRQAYPKLIREGAVLYEASTRTVNGRPKVVFEEWVVRSVQARRGARKEAAALGLALPNPTLYVNLALKIDGLTWVKRSKAKGDFGWKPSIPQDFRKQFCVGEPLPSGLYTTCYAALRYAVPDCRDNIGFLNWMLEGETDPELLAELRQELKATELQLPVFERRLRAMKREALAERARKQKAIKPYSGAGSAEDLQ